MRISIIIPTYNYAHYIQQAINSVIAQHDPNYQLIIIDDGSTDNTAQIIEPYIQQFPENIFYIYQQNRGAAAARNYGAQIAEGDYLLFLDADDRLLPNALRCFREFVQQNPNADVIYAGHISVEANGKRRAHAFSQPLSTDRLKNFQAFLRKNISAVNGATFLHKQVLAKLHYPEEFRNSEDIVFFAHAFALFNCISLTEPIAEIFKHKDSLRHQLDYNRKVGLLIVDRIFNPLILPKEFLKYRNEYYARRCLSLFRSLYLAGEYQEAKQFYKKAVLIFPLIIFKLAYLKKYLRIMFKLNFSNKNKFSE